MLQAKRRYCRPKRNQKAWHMLTNIKPMLAKVVMRAAARDSREKRKHQHIFQRNIYISINKRFINDSQSSTGITAARKNKCRYACACRAPKAEI